MLFSPTNIRTAYRRIFLQSVLFLLLCNAAFAGRPVILVTGFDVVDLGGNRYQFVPMCGSHPCSAGELSIHTYVWEIGSDFSVEAQPIREFSGSLPNHVTLRVTSIKEDDDPDASGNRVRYESAPGFRKTVNFTQAVNLLRNGIPKKTKPIGEIDPPDHVPVPGYEMYYVARVRNPTDCSWDLAGKITLKASTGPQPRLLDVTPISGTTIVDRSPPHVRVSGTVGPGEVAAWLLYVRIDPATPLGVDLVGDIDIEATPVTSSKCANVEMVTLRDQQTDAVMRSIDPNDKRIIGSRCMETGDVITYEVAFMNEGNIGETDIRIRDTFDRRLDLGGGAFLASGVSLDGAAVANFSVTTDPATNSVECKIEVTPPGLLSGSRGTFRFEIPIKERSECAPEEQMPDQKVDCDSLGKPLHNTAWTFFGKERRWYPKTSLPARVFCKAAPGSTPPWIWVVIPSFAILLLLLLARRRRRP